LTLFLQNNVLLTGGEDSKLNVWSCPPLSSSSLSTDKGKHQSDLTDMDVDEEDRSPTHKKRRS
jgi:WD repeat-containing protein 89